MAGEWSIEGVAQRVCGCDGGPSMTCRCHSIAKGIRAGLALAIEVSRMPDMLYVHELRWRLCERYGFPKDRNPPPPAGQRERG